MGKLERVAVVGESGTVGLDIVKRLQEIEGIEVVHLEKTREVKAQLESIAKEEIELAVLCLPDEAAKNFVKVARDLNIDIPKTVDASTAHRVAPGWVYGFPQMDEKQPDEIREAKRVSNPGCYATGAVAIIRPLIEAGVLPADYPVSIAGLSGYTGGGKPLIDIYQAVNGPAAEGYGFIDHKHIPEMEEYGKLETTPAFTATVGNFPRGMLVTIPLHLSNLNGKVTGEDLGEILRKKYQGHEKVIRIHMHPPGDKTRLDPAALAGSDNLELHVFWDKKQNQAVLVARLDNLGKGASGAAVENIKLMLGLSDRK